MSRTGAPNDRLRAWLAVALGLALLLGIGGGGCGFGELRAMPASLVGTWTTANPRYRGRALEIHPRRVVITDLGHPIDRYHIEAIWGWPARNGVVYELRCVTEEGTKDELRLTFVGGEPAYLKVGEAPTHWVRRHP